MKKVLISASLIFLSSGVAYSQGLDESLSDVQSQFNNVFYNANYYFDEGFILSRQGKDKEAIESYKKAIKLNPIYYEVYINLAILYSKNDKKLAIENYNKAIEIEPENPKAYSNLGVFYLIEKEPENAIKYLLKTKEIKENYTHLDYNLACAYSQKEETEVALEYLEKAIKNNSIYQKYAKKEIDFESLKNNPKFKLLVNPKK